MAKLITQTTPNDSPDFSNTKDIGEIRISNGVAPTGATNAGGISQI